MGKKGVMLLYIEALCDVGLLENYQTLDPKDNVKQQHDDWQ